MTGEGMGQVFWKNLFFPRKEGEKMNPAESVVYRAARCIRVEGWRTERAVFEAEAIVNDRDYYLRAPRNVTRFRAGRLPLMRNMPPVVCLTCRRPFSHSPAVEMQRLKWI
ncbi:hypothetical protein Nepgr_022378 [Nepenthes gracilis]|uniref:Uncharacterized protein n=1 Tax=Nepenthes gracilis TaxID=150966 RepID=A0AAD3T1V1_NEPGR|nr:hypothetical protein Nepgr_022378 [Nepenthes gracilis]